MAKCDFCGATILMGGVKDGDLRFCNQQCHSRGFLANVARDIPLDVAVPAIQQVHMGLCPKCGGSGPVDVHTSYRVWSAVFLTSWGSYPKVCCRSCGIKSQVGSLIFSAVLGWWGFPFGLVLTPVQIFRNLAGIVGGPDPSRPSPQLEKLVRLGMANYAVAQQQGGNAQSP